MKKLLLALMIFSCVFLMSSCDQSIGTGDGGKTLQRLFEESDLPESLANQTEVTTGLVELQR